MIVVSVMLSTTTYMTYRIAIDCFNSILKGTFKILIVKKN